MPRFRDGRYAATGWYGSLPSRLTVTLEDDRVAHIRIETHAAGPNLAQLLAGLRGRRDYREIGEAILVGDAKRAETSTRRHVRRMLKRLNRFPHLVFRRAKLTP